MLAGEMRKLRKAFVITGSLVFGGACSSSTTTSPDGQSPRTDPSNSGPRSLPLKDAEGHLIYRKSGGDCYVQVEKKGDPPADLMSGERWVDEKAVECPKELDDPAFAAVGEGSILGQGPDGKCFVSQTYGNPPPPPVETPCPAFAKKPEDANSR